MEKQKQLEKLIGQFYSLSKKLSKLNQGAVEIRILDNGQKAIYLHSRQGLRSKTTYLGLYSEDLIEKVKEDNQKAKLIKEEMKKINDELLVLNVVKKFPSSKDEIEIQNQINSYLTNKQHISPLFIQGDSSKIIPFFPSESVDCIITSPPYYQKRDYGLGSFGNEASPKIYLRHLAKVFKECFRILKKTGSLWVNIGDSYVSKSLQNLPSKLAILLTEMGFIERNAIVWNKMRSMPDNSNDKFRNSYEMFFFFTKSGKNYFFDSPKARLAPNPRRSELISATGINGKKYRKLISSSKLTSLQKSMAEKALDEALQDIHDGVLSDFRMIIKGQEKVSHSNSLKFSGRARELEKSGFYILRYNPSGPKLPDVWDINPVGEKSDANFYASFPSTLISLPLELTCPPNGTVVDPFCGMGTVCLEAKKQGKKSIGIDLNKVQDQKEIKND